MRRVVRVMAFASLGVLLTGVLGYIALTLTRGISPAIVPVTSGAIGGYTRGDAVLVKSVDRLPERGDLAVARVRGSVNLVAIESVGQEGTLLTYTVVGFDDRVADPIGRSDLVGFAGGKVPLVGWALLATRARAGQLVLALLVAAVTASLVLTRDRVATSAADIVPLQMANTAMLALPAGRPAPVSEPTRGEAPPAAYADSPETSDSVANGPATSAIALSGIPGALAVPYLGGLMSISPDELRQVQFAQIRRGYDTAAVDRALDAVADTLEKLLHERVELIEQIKRLEREAERLRGSELGLTQALNAAKAEAEAVRTEAARMMSAMQGSAPAPAQGGGGGDAAMVQLLGETRAMRSLLQSFLTQTTNQAHPDAGQPRPAGG